MRWLHERGIPFVLRLKENMHVWNENHVPVKLSIHANRLEKTPEPHHEWHLVSGS